MCVWVADVSGKKFDVAPGSLVAEIRDDRRHDIRRPEVGCDLGLLDGRRKLRFGRLLAPSFPASNQGARARDPLFAPDLDMRQRRSEVRKLRAV
jgi:hypothetical protein